MLHQEDAETPVLREAAHELTERAQDVATLNKRAHQIMSRKPITARPDTLLPDAVKMILEHRISCLPVTDDQMHPLGIVSWRDVLKTLTPEESK